MYFVLTLKKLKAHSRDLVLNFHKVRGLARDRLEKDWSKSKRQRPKCPDFYSPGWAKLLSLKPKLRNLGDIIRHYDITRDIFSNFKKFTSGKQKKLYILNLFLHVAWYSS